MKKWIAGMLTGALLLVGVSGTAAMVFAEETSESASSAEDAGTAEEEGFATSGYLYDDGFGDTMYFITVKNNTDKKAEIDINGTAYDEAGNALGAANGYIDVVGPQEESICSLYFDGVEDVDHVEYTLTTSSTMYEPVLHDLEVEESINDRNLTLVVTNNGEYAAQFVEAYALFLDADNQVVGMTSNYLTDSDYEIKVGARQSAQLTVYEDFDHVIWYLVGRSDGSKASAAEQEDNEDFEVKEYLYNTEFGDQMYFLAITNNSEEVVGINGNATAYDADGKVIGAGNCYFEVLGPGEEGLTYFYFDSIGESDHIDYQLEYVTSELYYEPVVGDIAVEENVNSENVVLQLTNNGKEAAEFVEAIALFFDAEGNVLTYASEYVMDSDNELKPGESLSVQLDAYETFDHVQWYLSGRHSDW